MDFSIRGLARDVIFATYLSIRQEESGNHPLHSLRSSIWKQIDGRWQMVFHQGTLVKESGSGIGRDIRRTDA